MIPGILVLGAALVTLDQGVFGGWFGRCSFWRIWAGVTVLICIGDMVT